MPAFYCIAIALCLAVQPCFAAEKAGLILASNTLRQGEITRVDNFGNLITNIHRRDLDTFLKSTRPIIEVGDLIIKKLSSVYADVEQGEILALINSSDWLEIAVHLGRASEYVGLKSEELLGTEVRVKKTKESF